MRNKLNLAPAVILVAAMSTNAANATLVNTLILDGDLLAGVTNVSIVGELYDATFHSGVVDSSNIYQAWGFTATSASNSLGFALQQAGFNQHLNDYDHHPELIRGCTSTLKCEMHTVQEYDATQGRYSSSFVRTEWSNTGLKVSGYTDRSITLDQDTATYVEWTKVSSVPLPGAVWFMGTALLGLVGYSRKSKSQVAA